MSLVVLCIVTWPTLEFENRQIQPMDYGKEESTNTVRINRIYCIQSIICVMHTNFFLV